MKSNWNQISRRRFLQAGFAAGSLSRLGMMNAFAQQPADYRALVCIFLFGGNDGNNTVLPLDATQYAAYAAARGGLALPSATLLPVPAAGGGLYGLHPRLSDIHPLYAAGRMAIVANVGMLVRPTTREEYQRRLVQVPSNLFSHSDQQLQWQTANPLNSPGSGWAGRTADEMVRAGVNAPSQFPTALSVAGNSIFLTGAQTQPGTVIPGTNSGLEGSDGTAQALARDASLQEILDFPTGLTLLQASSSSLSEGLRVSKLLNAATQNSTPLTTVFPATGLGRQLEQVAKILKVRTELGMRRQIFFCSAGGYDTHSNQLVEQDGLFAQLSPAIAAFYNATQEIGIADKVTTFTQSEFGRTLNPSAGAGTDHAWGSHHFVVGGAVNGGFYGRYPTMALSGPDDAGNRGSWIPTTSLDQYGATLATWFGLSPTALPAVFPYLANFASNNLGFLG